jgi:molecular chaperone GrpE
VAEDKNLKEEEIMNEETVEEVTEECETAEEVTEDTECEACEAGSEEDKKKGFFNKNKKDKKDPKDIQIEELSDKYRRTMAEFDNFRKRTEKEKAAMYEIGAKDIINKLLPVVDNFERGLASIPEADKGTPVADGMDKIYKQLTKMLEEAGVKEIEAEGQEFNPDFHNAVMHIDDETLGENVVAEVLLKGYTYRDSVVRHSMVKVAN